MRAHIGFSMLATYRTLSTTLAPRTYFYYLITETCTPGYYVLFIQEKCHVRYDTTVYSTVSDPFVKFQCSMTQYCRLFTYVVASKIVIDSVNRVMTSCFRLLLRSTVRRLQVDVGSNFLQEITTFIYVYAYKLGTLFFARLFPGLRSHLTLNHSFLKTIRKQGGSAPGKIKRCRLTPPEKTVVL